MRKTIRKNMNSLIYVIFSTSKFKIGKAIHPLLTSPFATPNSQILNYQLPIAAKPAISQL